MTISELSKCEKRIDEISGIIELCDPDRDWDVLDNLERELNLIQDRIESEIRIGNVS